MAKGSIEQLSTWDKWSKRLQEERSHFRMHRRKGKPFIFIRRYQLGKIAEEFSSKRFRVDYDEDIEACGKLCLKAHEQRSWVGAVGPETRKGTEHTWVTMIDAFWAAYEELVVRESSKKDHRSYCKQIRQFSGPVRIERLEQWIEETDPFKQCKTHGKKLQFLRDLKKYKFMGGQDYDEMIQRQKDRRPTKAQKDNIVGTEKPRAIPSDEDLYSWLKSIDSPLHQWAFAMVAVFGLRPSELWHLQGISESGITMVPAKPLCKTFLHPAMACPAEWVEEFGLRENFEKFHKELTTRYQLQWHTNRAGDEVPLNNSRVADTGLAQQIKRGKVDELMGTSWKAGRGAKEMLPCRVYDLRHAYAIRLWTNQQTSLIPMSRHAYWMGHSLQQHKDTYLKWMPMDLLLKAEEELFESNAGGKDAKAPSQSTDRPQALPADIQEKLERLELLEATL